MTRPFVVNVAAIKSTPGSRKEISVEGSMADLFVSGSHVPPSARIRFDGVLGAIEGPRIVAEGKVRAPFTAECRRCLQPVESQVESEVREVFERDATEGETYSFDGDNIDLEPMIREAVVLDLPEAPLCKSDCAGLCPVCGINRNEDVCDCVMDLSDPRWAALRDL